MSRRQWRVNVWISRRSPRGTYLDDIVLDDIVRIELTTRLTPNCDLYGNRGVPGWHQESCASESA
jgi:hypothetical protein